MSSRSTPRSTPRSSYSSLVTPRQAQVAQNLQLYREARQLTAEALSALSDVRLSIVHHLEEGQIHLDPDTERRLAAALHIPGWALTLDTPAETVLLILRGSPPNERPKVAASSRLEPWPPPPQRGPLPDPFSVLLDLEPRSPAEQHAEERLGATLGILRALSRQMGVTLEVLRRSLPTSRSTLDRIGEDGRLGPLLSKRIFDLAVLWVLARQHHRTLDAARHYMTSPHPTFAPRTPLELLHHPMARTHLIAELLSRTAPPSEAGDAPRTPPPAQ